jgi:hypothetical protein
MTSTMSGRPFPRSAPRRPSWNAFSSGEASLRYSETPTRTAALIARLRLRCSSSVRILPSNCNWGQVSGPSRRRFKTNVGDFRVEQELSRGRRRDVFDDGLRREMKPGQESAREDGVEVLDR